MSLRIATLCLLVPGALLADPCDDTCVRISFAESSDGFHEYVVSRDTYVRMVELSRGAPENRAISEKEAIAIAVEATSSSPDEVGRVGYGRTVKAPGAVWVYMVPIQSPTYDHIIVVGPDGEAVEPSLVEEGMTASPDCSNYRFNTGADEVGAG